MKKFIVALLLAMSVVAPGFAAIWYQFYGDEYGKAIYVDNASVEKTSDYAAVWRPIQPDSNMEKLYYAIWSY